MAEFPEAPDWVKALLREGVAIPAHPLALTAERKLDENRQRALTRYYRAAGAQGVAVGVHTTQFAIRKRRYGLFKPVLQIAVETLADCDARSPGRVVRVAGVCGHTRQALAEARLARELGYHAALLSLAALKHENEEELISHCRCVASELPLFGFYLQPAVGGRALDFRFWREFLEIPNVVAIKIAPFNRYETLDVVRAVAEAGRAGDVALYTGNDDSIVVDLVTRWEIPSAAGNVTLGIAGGLLGHWACWTSKAVELLEQCKRWRKMESLPTSLLTLGAQVTDSNGALFDARNGFAGCIPGIHEVLRRQGLLQGTWCLDDQERLSPGQSEEIDRIYRAYPHLNDDEFVRQHLEEWLA